ncbi:MAG: DNA mismatch repair endonuclease MutL [Ruminococcus sp.]|nr:DNA mismatch repair endonuclease MutL [Ruminococcus sp.]
MGVINVLDKHVAELIAAGEVVERPSSVIKELVENSIDAGAKNITVEIKNGGTTFMRVADDGCGIMRDDVKVAFLRHATSKVRLENDLDCISTLGFRGEALASISAVSRLQLITKNKNEEIGTSYIIEGGEEISLDDAGCPDGTTFVIRDLFYNIPARAKFLKKDVSEGNAVSNIIDKTALSHPEIAFTYIRDGKQALKTFGDGKLISAIYSVFGKEFASGLIPVEYQLDSIKVSGFVSKPVNSRPNRNMQNFFINGRYVRTRTGMVALEEAFKHSIMVGKFPSCVLNLELPYEMIDVNVHPSKIEVRFINERPVFDAVFHAVKSALLQFDGRKEAVFKNNSAFNDIKKFNPFKNAAAIIGSGNQPQAKPEPKKAPNGFDPFEEIDIAPKIEKKSDKKGSDSSQVSLSPLQDESMGFNDSGDPFDLFYKADKGQKTKQTNNTEKDNLQPDFKNEFKPDSDLDFSELSDNNPEKAVDTKPESDNNIKADYNSKPDSESQKENILPVNEVKEPEIKSESEPERISKQENQIEISDSNKPKEVFIKLIGEAFGTYIIAEKNGGELLLIDKHAAHERMIYEKLKSEKAGAYSQILLQPITVTLGKSEYSAAIENLEMFAECCFEVEDFGSSSVIVRSAPQYLDAADVTDSIVEMADYLAKGKNDIFTEKMDWFYHNVACRSAIKAGDKSSPQELIELVRKLEENPDIKYCPHGRPVCIVMKKSEIERQFGRA